MKISLLSGGPKRLVMIINQIISVCNKFKVLNVAYPLVLSQTDDSMNLSIAPDPGTQHDPSPPGSAPSSEGGGGGAGNSALEAALQNPPVGNPAGSFIPWTSGATAGWLGVQVIDSSCNKFTVQVWSTAPM